jgi:hypothetical protein
MFGWGQGQNISPFQFKDNLGNLDTTESDADRQYQQQLAQMLLQQAQGGGPAQAIAQQQLQQATDKNIASAMATGQSMPGGSGNNLAVARNILNAQAGAGQEEAGQSADLRAKLQLAGQNELGQQLQGMRGQDITQAGAAQTGELQAQQLQAGNDLATQQLINNALQGQASSTYGTQGVLGPLTSGAQGAGSSLTQWALSGGGAAAAASTGGKLPGKAKVPGDSEANDTIPILASPGEGIIPRSHMDDPEKAAAFAREMVLKKHAEGGVVDSHEDPEKEAEFLSAFKASKRNGKSGFKRMLAMQADHGERLAKLEKMLKAHA